MKCCQTRRPCWKHITFCALQVKHFIHKGKVHLGIYSLCPLPKGSEVTIAFEFSFDEYDCYLDCACAQDTCIIAKYNMKYQSTQSETNINRRLRTRGNDDSNSSHQTKTSPLRSLGSHSNQVRSLILFVVLPSYSWKWNFYVGNS